MKNLLLFLLLIGFVYPMDAARLYGILQDNKGNTLPFASVYITGTSTGTTSNADGYYEIELAAGTYEFTFQYIGYEAVSKEVTIGNKDIELNITLSPVAQNLSEVVVTAGEDPAYAIIRKAIRKRKYYQKQVKEYSCDSYVKGTQHIENLPKSFMGQSLEGFRQGLDSSGTGIIYLSESMSRLHYKNGEYKEIMTSSKVSGNDNGFSFNSGAALSQISFYKNSFELGDTKILSPIARNALSAYKYRLESTFLDKDDRKINKIEVIPKNKMGAVFQGYIYIVDEDWAIYSTDLFTTGKSVNISVLDTVRFKQTHINLGGDIWRVFTQNIAFNLKLLIIATRGNFVGVFSNYDLEPKFEKNFFNAEVFKVEDLANKKTTMFWDSIRPVRLSNEEVDEYQTKDSLQKIWSSKAYKDSIDRQANKPKILDLLTGYTWQNSYRNYKISIAPPIDKLVYNSVQGQVLFLGLEFYKGLDENNTRWFKFHAEGEYGISDQQFRGKGFFQMKFNSITNTFLHLEGGRTARQFNREAPIKGSINSAYTLLFKQNFAKLYDEYYGRVYFSQRFANIFWLRLGLRYARRMPLVNNTEYSFGYREQRTYFSNHPQDFGRPPLKDEPSFLAHNHFEVALALRIRFGQKYITYPNRRFYTGSKYPDIWIKYRRGIPLLGGATNFDYLEIEVEKDDIPLGTAGLFSFRAAFGWFPYRDKMYFMDYKHYNGNQTMFAKSSAYLSTFQLMPYYLRSSNTFWGEVHLEHDFNGFIWNKIPGLKTLGFEFVTGYHFTPTMGSYMEFNIGLDRIGWNLFRFLRADFVIGYQPGNRVNFGGVLSITLSL